MHLFMEVGKQVVAIFTSSSRLLGEKKIIPQTGAGVQFGCVSWMEFKSRPWGHVP